MGLRWSKSGIIVLDRAVSIREPVPNVQIADHPPISDFLEDRIGRPGSHSLWALGSLAGRKNGKQQDFAFRDLVAQRLDDSSHATGYFLRRVALDGIVVADQEDNGLRMNPVKVSMFNPPQHMLCAVTTNAEIGGFASPVISVPDFFSGLCPLLRNRVAQEYEIDITPSSNLVELSMSTPLPSTLFISLGRLC